MKRTLAFVCSLVMVVSFVSCSKKKVKNEKPVSSDAEVTQKYDELFGSYTEDKPIDSGVSILGEDFSDVDFTFTSPDGTMAFSLNDNSFAKLKEGGTYYNSIAPGGEVMSFEAGYKTSRGLDVSNSARDFVNTYKIADKSALFASSDGSVLYNPANGNFTGTLTTLYASKDGESYFALSTKEVEKFIYIRNDIADGAYMDPAKVTGAFESYKSIVSIDITADESGDVSEVAFYKFDK